MFSLQLSPCFFFSSPANIWCRSRKIKGIVEHFGSMSAFISPKEISFAFILFGKAKHGVYQAVCSWTTKHWRSPFGLWSKTNLLCDVTLCYHYNVDFLKVFHRCAPSLAGGLLCSPSAVAVTVTPASRCARSDEEPWHSCPTKFVRSCIHTRSNLQLCLHYTTQSRSCLRTRVHAAVHQRLQAEFVYAPPTGLNSGDAVVFHRSSAEHFLFASSLAHPQLLRHRNILSRYL